MPSASSARASRSSCRTSPRTWSIAPCSGATSPRSSASSCCSRVLGVFSYVLNVVSGLRYTRVSADILFDMRLALYQHLQRCRRASTRARAWATSSRASTATSARSSAWRRRRRWPGWATSCFSSAAPSCSSGSTGSCPLVTAAVMPLSLLGAGLLPPPPRSPGGRAAAAQRRHRQLPDRDAAGAHAGGVVQRAAARVGAFRRFNDRFIAALMGMQRVSYLAGGLPGMLLSLGGRWSSSTAAGAWSRAR
jgi:hypothetical protein